MLLPPTMRTAPSTTNVTTPPAASPLARSSAVTSPPDIMDTEDATTTMTTSTSLVPDLMFVVIVILIFSLTRLVHGRTQQQRQRQRQQQPPPPGPRSTIPSRRTSAASGTNTRESPVAGAMLTVEDRVEVYKTTFACNGNYLTLQSKHIIAHTTRNKSVAVDTNSTKDDEISTFVDVELGNTVDEDNTDDTHNDEDDDDDLDPSIHLSLASARNLPQQEAEIPTRSTTNTSSTMAYTTNANMTTTTKNTPTHRTNIPRISGTCVICLEQFHKDEVIVWSEDPTCHHVYHHDCLVDYFAAHAERTTSIGHGRTLRLDVPQNPCPTCRQPFCHVPEDPDRMALRVHKTTTAAVVTRTTTTTIAAPATAPPPLPLATDPSVAVETPARAE